MKNILIYTLFALSFLASQDTRSTIFSTGTPETEEGYLISGDTSVADRFSVGIDYAMEAFRVTLAMESIFATVSVSIHEDSNNEPGEILGTWDIDLSTTAPREYLIYTFDDCITFEAGHNYWISVKSEYWRDAFNGKFALIATHSGGSGNRFLIAFRSQLEYMGTNVLSRTISVSKNNPFNKSSINNIINSFVKII